MTEDEIGGRPVDITKQGDKIKIVFHPMSKDAKHPFLNVPYINVLVRWQYDKILSKYKELQWFFLFLPHLPAIILNLAL